jgi:hypothetical protein
VIPRHKADRLAVRTSAAEVLKIDLKPPHDIVGLPIVASLAATNEAAGIRLLRSRVLHINGVYVARTCRRKAFRGKKVAARLTTFVDESDVPQLPPAFTPA